jgi:hypothetical protein
MRCPKAHIDRFYAKGKGEKGACLKFNGGIVIVAEFRNRNIQ